MLRHYAAVVFLIIRPVMKFLCAMLWIGGMWLATVPVTGSEGIKELKAREEKVKEIVQRVMPSVVAVTSADDDKPGSGSGVIVGKDGLILTAAHVTQATGNDLTIIFPDGRRVKGTSLGANRTTDAGMARITDPAPEGGWPCVEMGNSDLLALGDWVIAMGHPGGYSFERRPPVRLGRVWRRDLDGALFTSCPLIGGDSGGPLFDLSGRVVGIHSSIHGSVEMNRHIAIDTLRFDWDKLTKDQTWGRVSFTSINESRPITGALFDRESRDGVIVKQVFDDLPAAKAGLKSGDLVKRFDGEDVTNFHALQRLIGRRKPGDIVPVAVQRGGERVELSLQLGRRFLPRRDAEGRETPDDGEGGPPTPAAPEVPGPRPWLGAVLEAGPAGPVFGPLASDGPAALAGFKPGDILTKINDKAVADATEAAEALLALPPDSTANFSLKREGQDLKIEVKLGKK